MTVTALIVAAGRGERIASETGDATPKQYRLIGGVPVLRRTIDAFLAHDAIQNVITVINPTNRDLFSRATAGLQDRVSWVAGGAERQTSVRAGLRAMHTSNPDYVLIHDGVRPFMSKSLIDRVLTGLRSHRAVIPVMPVVEALKIIENGVIRNGIDRRGLVFAQTPQGFHYDEINNAHARAAAENASGFADDADVAAWAGLPVHLTLGEGDNMKITSAEDLSRAERRLAMEQAAGIGDVRTGQGFDVHAYGAPGTRIMLCGVPVRSERLLMGHSDADVGLHALTDALLGAISAGDLGMHFPPGDPKWKDASSDQFVKTAARMVEQLGGTIMNVDVTVICETPKIAPQRDAMRKAIAGLLLLPVSRVSVKGTTTEGLGFTGRKEGIAAQATATIRMPAQTQVQTANG